MIRGGLGRGEPEETVPPPEAFSLRVGLDRRGGETVIAWSQPQAGDVLVEIFGIQGRPIRTYSESGRGPGNYQVIWDG